MSDRPRINRVAAFARDWRDDYRRQQQMSGRGTFVPLSFGPGEASQFDWSEDWAIGTAIAQAHQIGVQLLDGPLLLCGRLISRCSQADSRYANGSSLLCRSGALN